MGKTKTARELGEMLDVRPSEIGRHAAAGMFTTVTIPNGGGERYVTTEVEEFYDTGKSAIKSEYDGPTHEPLL